MLDIDQKQFYSSSLLSSGSESKSYLQTKLGLYQVFLRIYEQNTDLLNEILELEHSGPPIVSPVTFSYLQGVVFDRAVYLVTNLMGGTTQTFVHPDAQWTIGRDRRKSSLVLTDPRLSRSHACISYDFGQQQFYVSDLSSTNGTFINGEQVFQRRYLKDGDRIRLGGLSFTFFTYAMLPQSSPAQQETGPCLGTSGGNRLRSSGSAASKKNAHPLGHPGQRLIDPGMPDDTMIVPTPLRPSREVHFEQRP